MTDGHHLRQDRKGRLLGGLGSQVEPDRRVHSTQFGRIDTGGGQASDALAVRLLAADGADVAWPPAQRRVSTTT